MKYTLIKDGTRQTGLRWRDVCRVPLPYWLCAETRCTIRLRKRALEKLMAAKQGKTELSAMPAGDSAGSLCGDGVAA